MGIQSRQRRQNKTALLPAGMGKQQFCRGAAPLAKSEQIQIQYTRTPTGSRPTTRLLLQGLEALQQRHGGPGTVHQHHSIDVVRLIGWTPHRPGAKPGGAAQCTTFSHGLEG